MEFILGGNGAPFVKVTIEALGDGSFKFTLEQVHSDGSDLQAGDLMGEIRGLFFDVDGEAFSLTANDLTDLDVLEGRAGSETYAVTTGGGDGDDVTGFTKSLSEVNMNGAGLPEDGGYAVGIALGTSGVGAKGDDIQAVSFTLKLPAGTELEDLANQDFGIRMMSIGTVDANGNFITSRDGSAKIVGESGDVVTNEAPVATDATGSGNEDATSIDVTLTGTDGDGTITSVKLTSLPTHGTLYTDSTLTTEAQTGVDYPGSSVTFYFVPDADFNGDATFDFTVRDNDGASDATPATATITVDAVNDAPVNAAPEEVAVDEDTTLEFKDANAISVSDVDVGSGNVQVTLSVGHGSLALGTTDDLTLTDGDGSDGTLTIEGALAAVNAALASLSYTGDLNFNGDDKLTIETSDLGNTGSGGAKTDTDEVAITVKAVNDAPVNAAPEEVAVDEDTTLEFKDANAISVSDVDVGSGDVKVTLSVGHGSLALGTTDDLTLTDGDGSDGTLTIEGALAAVNAALASLSYTGDLNYNGDDKLTIETSDLGNTGSGGAKTDTDEVAITVNAVNDNPLAGNDHWFISTSTNDAIFALAALLGNDSDVDGDAISLTGIRVGNSGAFTKDGDDGTVDGVIHLSTTFGNVTIDLGKSTVEYDTNASTTPLTLDYEIKDGNGGSGIGTLTVTPVFIDNGNASDTVDLNSASYKADANSFSYISAGNGADSLTGGPGIDTFIGGPANDTLIGSDGDDTIRGGSGDDQITGGKGNDTIDVDENHDIVRYTSVNDGTDTIQNFDGNAGGSGQDVLTLDDLFDSLSIATDDRAALVNIVDLNGGSPGPTWQVQVNADGNAGNGFELIVANIQTTDAITVGQDVLVGTLV
jgi:RTX calcium-binding nonapeptide repeat (4 copies)/Bacterial cadherin-like domain/Bacterial Ig domain